jgi:LacI family transcriptional regulator
MRPTLKQIAKLANISAGTVDRVVNNRGRVRPETKERIEKIIKELNYKPNLFARNLALNPSFNIAVIMPLLEQDGGYWLLPKNGIDKAYTNLHHFRLNIQFFLYDKFSKTSFLDAAKKVLKGGFDGILLAPVYLEKTKWFLNHLPKSIPYVLIDTDIPGLDYLCSIHQNSYHGGIVAAQLISLVVQNPSSISLVRFLPDTHHINERLRGFMDYLSFRKDITLIKTDIPENCSKAGVEKIFEKLFQNNKDLKGVFVSNSHTYEVAQYLEKVNEDKKIFLIGFDLVPANIEYMKKNIIDFLISQDPEQQGYAGIYSLYKNLVVREKVDKEITVPIEIITKENLSFHDSGLVSHYNEFRMAYGHVEK